MIYDFNKVIDRRGTNSIKTDFMMLLSDKADADTIPMWVADMDFGSPKPVIEAIKKRAEREIFGYTIHYTGDYFRAVAGWMHRRFGWYVNSNSIMTANGVVPAIAFLISALTEEGDGVIIQQPVYNPFKSTIEMHNRVVVDNPLINTNNYYTMDFEDLAQKAQDPNNKVLILCSPHNPVGRVWKVEELQRLGEICLENNVYIISDEIHQDLINPDFTHTPIAKLFSDNDKMIITCTAPSKTFNIAGLQTSNIIITDKDLQAKYRKESMDKFHHGLLNPLSLVAAQAAYNEGEEWLAQVNAYITANHRFIADFVKKNLPKAKYRVPEGTYLGWLDLREYGLGHEALNDLIVEEAKVLFNDGYAYGSELSDGFMRVNVGTPRSNVKETCMRLASVLNRIHVGETLSDFNYGTPWVSDRSFNKETKDKKTCLVFLRYLGCSLCQLEMMEYQERYPEFAAKDTELYVVLQSEPEHLRTELQEQDFPFQIICDPDQRLYQRFNIKPAFSQAGMLSKAVIDKIMIAGAKGIKHGKYEGNEQQLPAAFVLDENGKVTFAYYGRDVGDVPAVDALLEQL